MLHNLRNFSDEARRLSRIVARLDRETRTLDVGCGYGRNVELLRGLGFRTVEGVEKNPALVQINRQRGVTCWTPEELQQRQAPAPYQLLVMSHIVEHFDYPALQPFIESYLEHLAVGGYLLIATPLLHRSFYNDFDHVKPYYPMGLQMVFGADLSQVQLQSQHVLELEQLAFFKDQLRLQFFPGLYLAHTSRFPIYMNRLLKLLFVGSAGHVGRKIGWIGLYRYRGLRPSSAR